MKISRFEDIEAWKEIRLVNEIYALTQTRNSFSFWSYPEDQPLKQKACYTPVKTSKAVTGGGLPENIER